MSSELKLRLLKSGGRVHLGMPSLGTSLGMIRDERLLALAVVTPKRSPLLPDVKKQMEAIDFIPAPTTPEEFDNIMRAMLVTFDEVARAAGLKAP